MTQRQRFFVGERLGATKLNRVAKQAFDGYPDAGSLRGTVGFDGIILLEIETINDVARTLTCKVPANVEATREQWTVHLPPIFTEASRGTATYVYSSLNNRQATDGATVEDQEITPNFVVGEVINVLDLGEETAFVFLGDGRMWAKV